MIVLVGGSGFIGKHFRDLLSQQGKRCTVVSRNPENAKRDYALIGERFISESEFSVNGEMIVKEASAIVSLASISVPKTFATEPWEEIRQNVAPTAAALLRFASINPAAKRIFISSGGTIYGSSAGPVNEKHSAAPVSPYGLGKLMLEETIKFSGRAYGTRYNILRLSNPVGQHHRNMSQGIVPVAMHALRTEGVFNIFGDGSAVRDYVDADDVADAILGACEDDHFNADIWNVGSGIGHSVLDMLALVEEVSGKTLNKTKLSGRIVDVDRIVLDCRKITNAIGWTPKRNIRTTISDMWNRNPRLSDIRAK